MISVRCPLLRLVLMLGWMTVVVGDAPAASPLIERLEAGESQTIVAYGTSLTAGGLWLNQLSSRLDAIYPEQITWINSGMSGQASNTGVANLSTRVLDKNPDAVFLEFAVNDAFTAYETTHLDFGITPEQSKANLYAMIDSILNLNPDTEILLQTMNPAWDAPNGNQSGTKRPNLETYYDGYREVAEARELTLVDNYAIWQKLQANQSDVFASYVSDGVHPNASGYSHLVTPAIALALGNVNNVALLVDPDSGRTVLKNQSGANQQVISYTISSATGALLSSWESLNDQGVEGWLEANPTPENLSELNAQGSLSLADEAAVDLGDAWHSRRALDISLTYQTADGLSHQGEVIYSTLAAKAGLKGDADADGTIGGLDFLQWQRDFGNAVAQFTTADWNGDGLVNSVDLPSWQANYGTPMAIATGLAVPEPSSVMLLVVTLLGQLLFGCT